MDSSGQVSVSGPGEAPTAGRPKQRRPLTAGRASPEAKLLGQLIALLLAQGADRWGAGGEELGISCCDVRTQARACRGPAGGQPGGRPAGRPPRRCGARRRDPHRGTLRLNGAGGKL